MSLSHRGHDCSSPHEGDAFRPLVRLDEDARRVQRSRNNLVREDDSDLDDLGRGRNRDGSCDRTLDHYGHDDRGDGDDHALLSPSRDAHPSDLLFLRVVLPYGLFVLLFHVSFLHYPSPR